MPTTVRGIARVDHRTKNLVKRIRRGEIAVIQHRDIDSVSAESLARCGVRAVVNADESISGKYPNRGPSILMEHGIPVVDAVGAEIMQAAVEGAEIEIDLATGAVNNGTVCAHGTTLTPDIIAERSELAKTHLQTELRSFVENTLQYVSREEHILLEPARIPELTTSVAGRHALIVVRGEDYRKDLRAIYSYIRDVHPVLIGVDGGADALTELGFRPDIIVGDMDSVSDDVLRCGAELVVHASPEGQAPGKVRLEKLQLEWKPLVARGTSEDVAMLLAYEKGADLIVALGTHTTLIDFLDKGRPGMASTFLTRLKVGNRLVDARGVSQLYSPRLRFREVSFPLATGLVVIFVVLAASDDARRFVEMLGRLVALAFRRVVPGF
ncbi:MAG: thiamin pyrophosphokinase [Armatimonadetes bacterium CG2_30_59_28]|nr:hypothetical protein [Armatimonadota bacterium]OIO98668.1 MAG: thiamin pyrophosphokinase [Armatimonadetes bacterium CG2_30_59_28]PIU61013.1 MAG: hypothetical protein COS85_22055 [Armatimonadetes bacterium CG07_land_8_20_14_0_80_59_28]PIX41008.1 MAG: hypothetical protein COZ56_13210 [Armatimonadetes bacterium CG_4_8_14_3_um_filter_58_9]PIY43536.1 MAG: hypothetical protein COZ05_10800 [Armatimonadetes bacterium CG_4_10_14_3_um_filter_59_10]PJB62112.1 MAG: hypothetical protein CO095_19225 [Arm